MKSRIILTIFMTIMTLFSMSLKSFAQESDTLVVDALPPGNLNAVIASDVDANGNRNPNRVYLLQQTSPVDTTYFMGAQLVVNFNLNIVGKPNPVTGRLPVIAPFPNASGSSPTVLFQQQFGGNVNFKNLYFCLWRLDSTGNARLLNEKGDSVSIIMDHCVVDGNNANVELIQSSYVKEKITNCLFRDVPNPNSASTGMVIGVNGGRDCDTVIMTNNTFYGAGAFTGAYCPYLLLDHNTFFMNTVYPLSISQLTNAVITNNIFYAQCAKGTDSIEIENAIANGSGFPSRIIALDTLSGIYLISPYNLTETGRNIKLKDNAYYWPGDLSTYWKSVSDTSHIPGLITPPVFMDSRDTMMFSDKTTWPNIQASDNVNEDPMFPSSITSSSINALIHYVNVGWQTSSTGGVRLVPNPTYSPLNAEESISPDWEKTQGYPVPENLKYTADLRGSDGFHLGDLNWFPGDTPEGVKQLSNGIPSKFELSQNYPNPFNPTTYINYSIPKSGLVTLKVYNILGQEVATLQSGFQKAGMYKVNFNSVQLASGVYLYRLDANGFSQVKKMILMK